VQFEGIVDRSQAENMRGIELEAEAVEIPGKLWVHELVGATVFDILVLESGGLIPLRFVTESDAAAGTLVVDIPDGLLDP
jgi:hypothetical protein